VRYGNCLTYALVKVFREGGRLVIERSEYGWWLHFSHMTRKDKVITHYSPEVKRRRWWPPLLFRGRVVRED